MKLNFKAVSFVRFGLCIATAVLLPFFLTVAFTHQLSHIHSMGLALMIAYILVVIFAFKRIYPLASKAVGQLCITFFLLSLSGLNHYRKMTQGLEETGSGLVEKKMIAASVYHAQSNIAIQMALMLLVVYIVLKIMGFRKPKADNNEPPSSD